MWECCAAQSYQHAAVPDGSGEQRRCPTQRGGENGGGGRGEGHPSAFLPTGSHVAGDGLVDPPPQHTHSPQPSPSTFTSPPLLSFLCPRGEDLHRTGGQRRPRVPGYDFHQAPQGQCEGTGSFTSDPYFLEKLIHHKSLVVKRVRARVLC